MTGVGQVAIERPETSNKPLGVLRHGLGEIPAGGGDCTDDGHRTAFAVQGLHGAGPLVELGDFRGQIRGEPFFGRHLFHATGQLPQRFGPARRGIGHDRHVIPLVTVVFGHGDAGVDTGLAGRDGHIGRVGDQDRSLHQGTPRSRIDQFGELGQYVRDLVAPLATTDVDDQVRVTPLGHRLLGHGFTRPEAARNGHRPPPGYRKERVNDALARDQRDFQGQTFLRGALDANGPTLHQVQRLLRAIGHHQDSDGLINRILPFRNHRLEHTAIARHHEDLVQKILCLRDRTEHHTAGDAIAFFHARNEMPPFLAVQRGDRNPPLDVDVGDFPDGLQGSLDSVVDRADHPGPQFHRKLHPGPVDRIIGSDARRIFIDLNHGAVFLKLDQLADQILMAHPNQFEHLGVGDSHHFDHRAVHPLDLSNYPVDHNYSSCLPANAASYISIWISRCFREILVIT